MSRVRMAAVVASLALCAATLVGCLFGQSPQQLVESRCTQCHTLAPIEVVHFSRAEWERTVYRMISHGAHLSDAQAQAVIAYLAETHGPQ